jgi:hypothetical protein
MLPSEKVDPKKSVFKRDDTDFDVDITDVSSLPYEI